MATPDAVLAAALEAVALGAECAAEDCSERLEVYADDRLYDLVHHAQTHYAAIAKALLEAEAENQRLTADLTRAIADLRGTEDNSDNLIGQSLIWIGGEEGEAWQDEFAAWYQPHQWPLGMHRALNAFLAGKVRDYRAALARREPANNDSEQDGA